MQIALAIGIISQSKALGRFHQQNVSIHFYHKTIQEFMAALHLTCTDTDDIRSYCTSLDKVMNVANILTFAFSLDPCLCSGVSMHFMDIVNTDADIEQYRQSSEDNALVQQLYKTQCRWFNEIRYSQLMTGDTSPPPNLHVTDIYLVNSNSFEVRLTGEMMTLCSTLDSIVSVSLCHIYHSIQRIVQCLPLCHNMSGLCISYITNKEDNNQLVLMIPPA